MKKSYSKIGDFEISGRFTIPSGIVTTTPPAMLKFARDCEALGIITSKSIGPEPRKGNPPPIISQEKEYMLLNAVGLSNPGIDSYVSEMREIREVWPENKFLLTSVFGKDKDEFVYVATKAADVSDGIELNFGCPHSGGLAQIGRSPELVEEITAAVIESVNIPVLPKLTPSAYDIAAVAKAAENSGAAGIVAINTVGPCSVPELYKGRGSMSGLAIKRIGIRCVQDIANTVDLPVIGMGGISTLEDIAEYENAGADFFGIGSALVGMGTKDILNYFNFKEYSNLYYQKTSSYAKPSDAKLVIIKQVSDKLKLLKFRSSHKNFQMGQFMMLKTKDGEAKPFTIADDDPLTFAVRNVGENTSKINNLRKLDTVEISGPYGKPFELRNMSKTVLVGGGTGNALLNYVAKCSKRKGIPVTHAFIGAKTREELIFEDSFRENVHRTFFSTDDGSSEIDGLVTDLLEEWLHANDSLKDIQFVNCGPEAMIKKSVELEKKYIQWENPDNPNIYCAVERYTKCGIGLCGSCEIDGHRACVDGPIFNLYDVKNAIGVYKRDAAGARVVA